VALLQQPIQRKLSALIGADVTFEKLNLSLLGGSIDAIGVTVAGRDKSLPPVLTIARVRAEVSIKRALKGEIVVKSLAIERPVVNVVRRSDGATNLPERVEADIAAPPTPPALTASPDEEEDKSRWSFDVEKVLLVDGTAHVAIDLTGGTYRASVEKLLAEMKRSGDGYALTVVADSVGRRDVQVDLGQLRGTGTIGGAADLTAQPRASLEATIELGQLLKLTVRSPQIKSRAAEFMATGNVELAAIRPLLPEGLVLPVTRGGLCVDIRGRYDGGNSIDLWETSLRASDVAVRI
jgi:hypothetical protein